MTCSGIGGLVVFSADTHGMGDTMILGFGTDSRSALMPSWRGELNYEIFMKLMV